MSGPGARPQAARMQTRAIAAVVLVLVVLAVFIGLPWGCVPV